MKRKTAHCRGSFTVEASLVISTLLLLLSAVILSMLLLYQQVTLAWIAKSAAQEAADIWTDSRQTMATGAWDRKERMDSLYFRIWEDALLGSRVVTYAANHAGQLELVPSVGQEALDPGRLVDKKLMKLVRQVTQQPAAVLLRPAGTRLQIEYRNRLVQRKITVILQHKVKVPFADLSRFFGKDGTVTLTGRGVAVITEPQEFVRNVDLLVESASRAKQTLNMNYWIDDLKDRLPGR